MRRKNSSDFVLPTVTGVRSSQGQPQHPARSDAPTGRVPRVLHHPNEVTTLLDIEDLSSCDLSLRLDTPMDTATCRALTQLFQRADVHLVELSLTLGETLDADALAALVTAAEAHRDSLTPAGFQLQGPGVPLPDSLRLVLAGSRLCLELGGPTVRPLLFGHHLQRLNDEKDLPVPFEVHSALPRFLQCQSGISDSEWHAEMVEALSPLAQYTNDFALMRACSVLSTGSQVELRELPGALLCNFLVQWKIPYRLNLTLLSAAKVHALAQWLSQARPLFQSISLYGFPLADAVCWTQTFAGLLSQPDLQGVCLTLMPSNKLPGVPDAPAPTKARLSHLMVWYAGSPYDDSSKPIARFVAELTRYLNPEHVVLEMYTQTNIERVIDQLSQGSPHPLLRLRGLHIGWTADAMHPASGKGLKRMFTRLTANGMTCTDADPPDSNSAWEALAERSTGESLQLSLRPGPAYGLNDSTKRNSTLRFQRNWKADYLLGAAETMLQALLQQNDRHHGMGEVGLARKFIAGSPFSPRDLNALARVSRATHRGGQVAAIVWVLQNLPTDAPALRKWFMLPSGALDNELVKAVRTRLEDMNAPEPWRDLVIEATASQSV